MYQSAPWARDDRGVALLTVLLLMTVVFLLVSTMLFTSTYEIDIAGLHRDGIRAEEYAQAGLVDASRRLESGRAWRPGAVASEDACALGDGSRGFTAPLPASDICVAVVSRLPGPSGAVLEVKADAMVGRVRRRLSGLVLARASMALPGALIVDHLREEANTQINSGEVHAQTFVRYAATTSAARTTYAGWRIRQTPLAPGGGPCYTHEECVALGHPQWWPGQRRAAYPRQMFRPVALPGNPQPDGRSAEDVLTFLCPDGPPPDQRGQTLGANGPGYQDGDERADLNPSDPQQDALAAELLYGCTRDGLPYTWVREAFDTDDDPDADPDRFVWSKVIGFDRWVARYWCFDETPGVLAWMPCNGFHPDPALGDPSLGAVRPLMPLEVWAQNYDQRQTGGGAISAGLLVWGTCSDPPQCRNPANSPEVILLDKGSYMLTCPGSCPPGHGVLMVDGDLEINGDFVYQGTVVVRGALTLGAGTATIHGNLSAARVVSLAGALRLFPGTRVAGGAVGPLTLIQRAWWER